MDENKSYLAAFLSNYLLFSEFDDDLFEYLINSAKIRVLKPGEILYTEAEENQEFYILWSGKMHWFRSGNRSRELATYIIGDYFGEDWLVSAARMGAVEALETTRVVVIERAVMEELFSHMPRLKKLLVISARSRRLAYNKHLQWLGENEALYFIARKHSFFLYLNLIIPALILLLSIPFWLQPLLSMQLFQGNYWFPGCLSMLALLWGIWVVVDWGNDYYIVTSQRVTWSEKIIAIYDSRQEAPLNTILTTNKISNQTLRLFIDYATVVVKTYTGSIVMRWSQYPDEMIIFINGFKSRARAIARQEDNKVMEEIIRKRLRSESTVQESIRPRRAGAAGKYQDKSFTHWLRNALKLRFTEGDSITYRKHWFILIRKTFLPLVVNLGVIALAILLWQNQIFQGLNAFFFWIFIQVFTGFWLLYQYLDWHNDIYILTLDKVLDIERKPFTREDKKEASLENILSLENSRVGILSLLLNFGTVTINVGIEKLTFDYVFNPVQVQYEVSDRMYALRRRKQEEKDALDHERFADWLMIYHQQAGTPQQDDEYLSDDDISG